MPNYFILFILLVLTVVALVIHERDFAKQVKKWRIADLEAERKKSLAAEKDI